MSSWWTANWGNVASVAGALLSTIGLILSFLAWRGALRAEQAAAAAKDKILTKNFSDDVYDAVRHATNALHYLDVRPEVGAYLVQEALLTSDFLAGRWNEELTFDERQEFTMLATKVRIAQQVLSRSASKQGGLEDREPAIDTVRQLSRFLSALHGRGVRQEMKKA